MKIERLEDIEEWQLARELTRKVYALTNRGFIPAMGGTGLRSTSTKEGNPELRTQNPELRTQNPEPRTLNPEPRTFEPRTFEPRTVNAYYESN